MKKQKIEHRNIKDEKVKSIMDAVKEQFVETAYLTLCEYILNLEAENERQKT